ncbi:MAG TPA: pyridoxamine 5'-phosphate oxidase family protein [Methylomirabilota bacterium]|nr:pyridoxamine 5'-phosphate oxidase family protein [Methylomirabilota bacterium]
MSPFHEGERAVQARAGVRAAARDLGRGIFRVIPAGAIPFLEHQRLAALAGTDDRGRVWASVASGPPGFITAPDPHTLRLAAPLAPADPLREGLAAGRAVGVLVLDLERRRRIRLNGRSSGRAEVIEVTIEEVFGNCPKYIQARTHDDRPAMARPGTARRAPALSTAQGLAIARADTFFIASRHAAGADASHRGGRPGFVKVDDAGHLRFPDYAGNNMFQTLGNLTSDPRVGLVFVDWDTGATWQLTGRAHIRWDAAARADLPGAERAVEVEIDEVVEIDGRGPIGWRLLEYSPVNPR